MKHGFLFTKKHVKCGRMIKSALFKVRSIACYTFSPPFEQFGNTTSEKIFPFCCEPFFHIIVRTEALLSKYVTFVANLLWVFISRVKCCTLVFNHFTLGCLHSCGVGAKECCKGYSITLQVFKKKEGRVQWTQGFGRKINKINKDILGTVFNNFYKYKEVLISRF